MREVVDGETKGKQDQGRRKHQECKREWQSEKCPWI